MHRFNPNADWEIFRLIIGSEPVGVVTACLSLEVARVIDAATLANKTLAAAARVSLGKTNYCINALFAKKLIRV